MKIKYLFLCLFIIFLVACGDFLEIAQNQGPTFGYFPTTLEINEELDCSVHPLLLLTITATNTEGDPITYNLDQSSLDLGFMISNSGEIFYAGSGLNYESMTNHVLLVTVADSNGRTTKNITAIILDIDDPFIFISPTTTSIEENQDGSTNSIFLLTATAIDEDYLYSVSNIVYSLDQNSINTGFAINSNTGIITYTGMGFDYEGISTSYTLTATASNSLNTQTITQDITVEIIGVNEHPPRFLVFSENAYSIIIRIHDTLPVGSVIHETFAEDSDRDDTIVYEWEDEKEDFPFYVNNVNNKGYIIVDGALNFETKSIYSNQIKATDSGGLFDKIPIIITLRDGK